ncbi:putative DNA topoisomerase [Ferrimonas sediminum]|uniref:Putative DNA topoisomerase n=1 Tax=Ferrimonas sediminum TaxID=718193 RepID=A0A1G9AAK8_9GAMM|nr:topoisomerase DNA-binding C4 zinc finger domain-containing protein [Ferrimonas sediminum]SDK24348.1 putative DNA topoisomerase [Ferrimonas sediminum]
MSRIDTGLFNAHEHALEREFEVCPLCGSELHILHGKRGQFLGCQSYPGCSYSRPLTHQEVGIIEVMEDQLCPECERPLALKSGRYGIYIGCTGYPECSFIVREEEPETDIACPECRKGQLVARSGRTGKTFYGCNAYPKCKYVVNEPPHAQTCPDCGWKILVEKRIRGELRLICPQRACKYRGEAI